MPYIAMILSACRVDDGEGLSDSCIAQVTVEDNEPPAVACNAPGSIAPSGAPISFMASTEDNCGSSVEVTGFDCFTFTKKGKRIDKTESCVVSIDNDTVAIADSGGINDHISWDAIATDVAGNTATTTCDVVVAKPGAGS